MNNRRINRLDEIKGMAMLMVIFTHNSWSNNDRRVMGFPFWIDMAVPIFMMITGYLNAKSAIRQNQINITDGYKFKDICKKLLRFYMPYLFACLIILTADYIRAEGYIFGDYFNILVLGKAKYGGYYTFMLFQLVFIFPVIYQIIRRKPVVGLTGILIFNIVFEHTKNWVGIDSTIYRVLVIRLIFSIALGIFIAVYDKQIPGIMLMAGCVLGGVINFLNYYYDMEVASIDRWVTKSWPAALFVLPLIYGVVKSDASRECRLKLVGLIGAKSYHIFLAQMVYYCSFKEYIYVGIETVFSGHWQVLFVKLAVNMIICVSTGLGFAYMAEPIESKVIGRLTGSLK